MEKSEKTFLIKYLCLQHQALATFNFLNSEKRYVAGAMIPPTYLESVSESEEYENLLNSHLSPNERDFLMTAETDKPSSPDFTINTKEMKEKFNEMVQKKVYRKDQREKEEKEEQDK